MKILTESLYCPQNYKVPYFWDWISKSLKFQGVHGSPLPPPLTEPLFSLLLKMAIGKYYFFPIRHENLVLTSKPQLKIHNSKIVHTLIAESYKLKQVKQWVVITSQEISWFCQWLPIFWLELAHLSLKSDNDSILQNWVPFGMLI